MLERDVDATILSPIPLIYDTNLPSSELVLLYELYFDHSPNKSDCRSVILQHLFGAYGLVFANKCLHYAALAFQVAERTRRGLLIGEPWHPLYSGEIVHTRQFLSLVNRYLMEAINDDSISECHLFALILAIFSAQDLVRSQYPSILKPDRSEEITYERGCIEVLEHLTCRRSDTDLNAFPLEYLWHYAVSFVFRIDGSWLRRQEIWKRLRRSEVYRDDLNFLPSLSRLCLISHKISFHSNPSDPRIELGIATLIKQRKLVAEDWHGLFWYVLNLNNDLAGCFETAFVSGLAGNEDPKSFAESTFKSIRSRLSVLQKLWCISSIHELVPPIIALLMC